MTLQAHTPSRLPTAWVEKIFRKLTLTYGRDFTARWEGLETADVIEDWAEELSGFAQWPEAIGWALQNMPTGKPPTVLEFRAMCFKAPKPDRPQLPEPAANPERVTAELTKLARPAPAVNAFTDWIPRGLARLERGEKVSPGVRQLIEAAAKAKGLWREAA